MIERVEEHAEGKLLFFGVAVALLRGAPVVPLRLLFLDYLQDLPKWQDPDSNRGHHDFQSYSETLRYADLPHR
jgi:hypothetical protein